MSKPRYEQVKLAFPREYAEETERLMWQDPSFRRTVRRIASAFGREIVREMLQQRDPPHDKIAETP